MTPPAEVKEKRWLPPEASSWDWDKIVEYGLARPAGSHVGALARKVRILEDENKGLREAWAYHDSVAGSCGSQDYFEKRAKEARR